MDLSRLELFTQAALFGSFTKAAVMLDTTPSAISRQISLFETECGGRLFHRTGRGIALTELGERILPRVQLLLADAKELDKEIKGFAGIPSGEVRVGILAATANVLLPPLFKQLQENYPDVILSIFEGSPGQMDEWIGSGHVDIGLMARQGKSFSANEHPLTTNDNYLVGTGKDPLTQQETIAFDQLHQLPLILAGLPNGMRKTLEQLAKQKNMKLRVVMEANSLLTQIAMATNGCGYIILPIHTIPNELRTGSLSAARIVEPSIRRTITLSTTMQRPLTLASRIVLRTIRSIAEDLVQREVWTPVDLSTDAE